MKTARTSDMQDLVEKVCALATPTAPPCRVFHLSLPRRRRQEATPTVIKFAPGEVERFVRETKAWIFWLKVIASLWCAVAGGAIVIFAFDLYRAAGSWSGVAHALRTFR